MGGPWYLDRAWGNDCRLHEIETAGSCCRMTAINWLWQSPSSLTILILFGLAGSVLISTLLPFMFTREKDVPMRTRPSLREMDRKLNYMHRDLHIIMRMIKAGSGQISPADQARIDEILAIETSDAVKIEAALADK
jgi:hypothetical protein